MGALVSRATELAGPGQPLQTEFGEQNGLAIRIAWTVAVALLAAVAELDRPRIRTRALAVAALNGALAALVGEAVLGVVTVGGIRRCYAVSPEPEEGRWALVKRFLAGAITTFCVWGGFGVVAALATLTAAKALGATPGVWRPLEGTIVSSAALLGLEMAGLAGTARPAAP